MALYYAEAIATLGFLAGKQGISPQLVWDSLHQRDFGAGLSRNLQDWSKLASDYSLDADTDFFSKESRVASQVQVLLACATAAGWRGAAGAEDEDKALREALRLLREERVPNHQLWREWYAGCAEYLRRMGYGLDEMQARERVIALSVALEDETRIEKEKQRQQIIKAATQRVGGRLGVFLASDPPSLQTEGNSRAKQRR